MEFLEEEIVAQPPQDVDVEIENAMSTFSLYDDEEDNNQIIPTISKAKAANNDSLDFKIEEITTDNGKNSKELIDANCIENDLTEKEVVQTLEDEVPSDDEFGTFQASLRK